MASQEDADPCLSSASAGGHGGTCCFVACLFHLKGRESVVSNGAWQTHIKTPATRPPSEDRRGILRLPVASRRLELEWVDVGVRQAGMARALHGGSTGEQEALEEEEEAVCMMGSAVLKLCCACCGFGESSFVFTLRIIKTASSSSSSNLRCRVPIASSLPSTPSVTRRCTLPARQPLCASVSFPPRMRLQHPTHTSRHHSTGGSSTSFSARAAVASSQSE